MRSSRNYKERLRIIMARYVTRNKLSNKMKTMSEEFMKGNEIIKKLQGEIKNYHGKVCNKE